MRFSELRTKTAVTVIAVTAATSAFGYWGYGELRAHQLRDEITTLVTDASLRMQAVLSTEVPLAIESPAVLRRFYEHAEAVDANFRKLSDENIAPVASLADAADDYLLTSREILLRRASSERYRQKLSGSIRKLREHMAKDDRTSAWVSEAVRAKENVEDDYRDYNRAVNALGTLLAAFPAARHKMASQLDPALLTDEKLVAMARAHALAASNRAADEIDKIRQLRTYR
jgi:hypothetical protein